MLGGLAYSSIELCLRDRDVELVVESPLYTSALRAPFGRYTSSNPRLPPCPLEAPWINTADTVDTAKARIMAQGPRPKAPGTGIPVRRADTRLGGHRSQSLEAQADHRPLRADKNRHPIADSGLRVPV